MLGVRVAPAREAVAGPVVRVASACSSVATAIRPVTRRPSARRTLTVAVPYETDVRSGADVPARASAQAPKGRHGVDATVGRVGQEKAYAFEVRGRSGPVRGLVA